VQLPNGPQETRETLLWDLAGQPGYRLIHQLYLNEVAVALIVFDARNETNPFASIYHWNRALRITQSSYPTSMKKFLVAARIDRGGVGVSRARIDGLVRELQFDGYFETSAKEGIGVRELKDAVIQAIDWKTLPWVSSTELFQRIKDFLIKAKKGGLLLSSVQDLYHFFLKDESKPGLPADLYDQFKTCIGRVESRGLIRQLSFGNLVLLQPEKLDTYASAFVNSIKDEPEGLGSISEDDVRMMHFKMPESERIQDTEQESVLLIAMVEDLLRYEIALREQADDGTYLVFPS
jgi:hypothetical protein